MRNIKKRKEPKSLAKHRCKANADYDNYAEKDDLRVSLVAEQQGVCCYCLQRIRPNGQEMKIEHWKSQSRYPALQLVYSNLLGVCNGGKDKREADQHCDALKGNRDLLLNPSDPTHDVEAGFHYLGNGRVKADDAIFEVQINKLLNLNEGYLVKNRKGLLDAFRQYLITTKPTDTDLKKELKKWNGSGGGDLEPFCQVVVYYLKKKLKLTA
jgi:uncharacterized protein (TIGR02646 family)